jgi:hypothetical protein
MSELVAKPVVKNKFWVVEESGQKIATIQARDDGGFVYVHDNEREYFPTLKNLKKKYDIKLNTLSQKKLSNQNHIYGFPIQGKAYNVVYDVIRKLPIYSKTAKSRSLFCAGYYLIDYNGVWSESFCPKNITISRYSYHGPFNSQSQMQDFYRKNKCKP